MRIHFIPALLVVFVTIPAYAETESFDDARSDYARELAACSSYYQITSGQTRKQQQQMQKTAEITYNFSSDVLGEEEARRVSEKEQGELEKTLGDCLPRPGRVTRESLGCETLAEQVHEKYAENCDMAVRHPTQRIEYWKTHEPEKTEEPKETPAPAPLLPGSPNSSPPEPSATAAPEAADPVPAQN